MSEMNVSAPGPALDPMAASLPSELADIVAQAKRAQADESKQEQAVTAMKVHVGRFMRHRRLGDVVLVTDASDLESVEVLNIVKKEMIRATAEELQMEFVPGSWVNVCSKRVHTVRELTMSSVRPALVLNAVRNNKRGHFNTLQARQLSKNSVSMCQSVVSRWDLLAAEGTNPDFVRFLDGTTMMRAEHLVDTLPRTKWAPMHPTWAPSFAFASGIALPTVPGLVSLGAVLSKPRFGDNTQWLQCVRLVSPCNGQRAAELCGGQAWRDTDLEIYMVPSSHARLRALGLIEAGTWQAQGYLCPHPGQTVLQSQDLVHIVSDTFCEDHFLQRLDDPRFRGFVVHVGAQTALPLMAPSATGYCDEAVPDASGKVDMLPYFSTEVVRAFFEAHPYLSLQRVPAGAWSACEQLPVEQEAPKRAHKRRRTSASRSVTVEPVVIDTESVVGE